MMEECILGKNDYNGLHRLGLSLHVYADTWAHQNFAGIVDKINRTKDIHIMNKETGIFEEISIGIESKIADVESVLTDKVLPLGHGTVKEYPDLPYLIWSYTDYSGNKSGPIDNSDRFIKAAKEIYKYLKCYQISDPKATIDEQLSQEAEEKIRTLFQDIQGYKQNRHEEWQNRLEEDYFGFHDEAYPYIPYGSNSWKSIALNKVVRKNDKHDIYEINESFFNSDWKKFHDAVNEHWDFVMNNLLPNHEVIIVPFARKKR